MRPPDHISIEGAVEEPTKAAVFDLHTADPSKKVPVNSNSGTNFMMPLQKLNVKVMKLQKFW